MHNQDSRFNRYPQILIKIQDLSQDLKYFKSLKYCEVPLHLTQE